MNCSSRSRQWATAVAVVGAIISMSSCLPEPELIVSYEITGLDKPWDLGWLPNGSLLVTERPGRLNIYANGNASSPFVIAPQDVVANSEGGMLGLEVDPEFEQNGYVYVCMCSNAGGPTDVRLVRFQLNQTGDALLDRNDIVTGMPYSGGRHSGCRPRFGPDGYLWVGTGDAALSSPPQDDDSLGGKVLRVTRDGQAAPGNPEGRLWYSKGHRNVQGLAFRSSGLGVSVEHGPSTDDEINLLTTGNFGWDPGPGYDESVPMTDLDKYPDAVEALWSSGSPTIAPSGATFVEGLQWGLFRSSLVVATLKASHLRFFIVGAGGDVVADAVRITDEGRLRSPRQGPDGNLYVTTDGGSGSGKVLKITPSFPEE
jgi:glucose/arabinose dehydrogenase